VMKAFSTRPTIAWATSSAEPSQVLERAVARGELSRADAAIALDLVYGSLWYRLIFDIGPLNNSWADNVARTVTSGGSAVQPR
jgi:hypothetical protein